MKMKWSHHLPNLLTTTNMVMGVVAIFLLLETSEARRMACALVLVGALADACDGSIARLLGAESVLGKQLDSFADSTTFGLAPAAILYSFPALKGQLTLLPLLVLYAMAGFFRLARYNLGDFSNHFQGLPITAAGFIVAVFALLLDLYYGHLTPAQVRLLTAVLLVGLSLAMVSRVKISRPKLVRK